MKLSVIRKEVSKRIEEGTKITAPFIRSLSDPFYNKCVSQATDTRGNNWLAALMRLLWPDMGKCQTCKEPTCFVNCKQGFQPFCSRGCANKNVDKIQNTKESNLAKFGSVAPIGNDKVMAKFKSTMLESYGVEFSGQSKKLLKKQQRTMLDRHGVLCMSQIPEVAAANAEKWRRNSKQWVAKAKQTMRDTYGVEHSMHIPEVFEKQQRTGFHIKKFKLMGKTFKVRGYEDIAIKYLNKRFGIPVSDILHTAAEGRPSIKYQKDTRMYYPDLYVKRNGKWYIVEVKSTYTAGLTRSSSLFQPMIKKLKGSASAGYRNILIIADPVQGCLCISNPESKSKKQILEECQSKGFHLPR